MAELRRAWARPPLLLLMAAAFFLVPEAGDAWFGVAGKTVHAAPSAAAGQHPAQSPPSAPANALESESGPTTAPKQPLLRVQVAQLLKLAQQLQFDVNKTNKDTLSLSVVRKADAIEELARTMKAERPSRGARGH